MTTAVGLKFELGANIAAFRSAMDDAGRSMTTLKDHTSRMADQMSQKFGLMASKMKSTMLGVSSALAAAGSGDDGPLVALLDSGAEAAKTRALALGTAIGAIFAGPLGAAAGAAIGSALGNLYDPLEKFVALKISETVFDSGLWKRMAQGIATAAGLLQTAFQPAISYLQVWQAQIMEAWDKATSFADGVQAAFMAALVKPFGVSNEAFNAWVTGIQSAWAGTGSFWDRVKNTITAALEAPLDGAIAKLGEWSKAVREAYDGTEGTWAKIGAAIKSALTYPFEGATEQLKKSGVEITDWSKQTEEKLNAAGSALDKWMKKRAGVWKDDAMPAPPDVPQAQTGPTKLDPFDRMILKIREQAQLQDMLAATLGKSAGEALRYRLEIQSLTEMQRANVTMTDAQRKKLQEYLDKVKESADATAYKKFLQDLQTESRASFNASMTEIQALGRTADEVARLRFEKQEYMKYQRLGIPITEEVTESIRKEGEQRQIQVQLEEKAKRSFDSMKDSMQAVGRGADDMFSKFVNGTKITSDSFRDMAASILADLAKLTLKNSVLEPLFGGASQGSTSAGTLGNALYGLFGGFRANGGGVDAGRAYMVGERGPELFVPPMGGRVIPNHALDGGKAAPVLNLSIDARGATPDAVHMLEARIPSIVMQTMTDARDRGHF